MKPEELKALDTAWIKKMQTAQLRLRCAEIIFVNGSQLHRTNLDEHAQKLYDFAMK